MVPEGWIINNVGDLFTVQLGKMLNKEAKAKFPQFKYLGNSDVKWGSFDLSQAKSMHFNEKERQKFTLQKGDILMCEGGEVGRCSIWEGNTNDIYYQKALHRLRSNGTVIPEYFYNFMSFIAGTKALDDYTTRTSIAHLTREKLLKIPVKTPPLPEQRKIAKILSTWDKAISTTERLIDNSKQQKKALMQQLLTGKKRLLDDSGRPFEGEWDEICMADMSELMTDYVANGSFQALRENVEVFESKDFAYYVRLVDLRAGLGHESQKYVNKASYDFLKKSSLTGGELLMANIGANVG